MTAKSNPAEVDALLLRMQAWEDDPDLRDGTCVRCRATVGGCEPEHEPSPLCNMCAQDLATRTFPDQLESARAEIERLRGDLEYERKCHEIALEEERAGFREALHKWQDLANRKESSNGNG